MPFNTAEISIAHCLRDCGVEAGEGSEGALQRARACEWALSSGTGTRGYPEEEGKKKKKKRTKEKKKEEGGKKRKD